MENDDLLVLQNSFLNPNWENSYLGDSNLSSIVSSPTNSLILYNASDYINTTPLKSPLPGNRFPIPANDFLAPFSSDPGFPDRAAKFSPFRNTDLGFSEFELISNSRILSNGSFGIRGNRDSCTVESGEFGERCSISEQISGGCFRFPENGRTRKWGPYRKCKEPRAHSISNPKVGVGNEESKVKRRKWNEGNGIKRSESVGTENENRKEKILEAPKDYIHVRARRGEATDSHSLAERVRREKISERMKFLQDLVPGCDKVTGKALMLDEIINYVQSLQRQVEFLSMKLATVNPIMELSMEALLSNDILQSRESSEQTVYPFDSLFYGLQSQQDPRTQFSISSLNDDDMHSNPSLQMTQTWQDDLQSLVQMGMDHRNDSQTSHGSGGAGQMKIELQ